MQRTKLWPTTTEPNLGIMLETCKNCEIPKKLKYRLTGYEGHVPQSETTIAETEFYY